MDINNISESITPVTSTVLSISSVGALALPSGTTLERPGSPADGMIRYNSTVGAFEFYNSGSWGSTLPPTVLQTAFGTITSGSANNQIPYDNTVPTITEGVSLWSRSFTPLSSTSTIIITTSGFYTVSSTADVYTTGATFSGTTNIGSQLLGFSTNTGEGASFTSIATTTSGSTTARTYSFRAGPGSNVTVFYMQGVGGQAYGSSTNSGRYIIQEIEI